MPLDLNTKTQKLQKNSLCTNIYKGEDILQIFIEVEGSVRNCTGVLNGPLTVQEMLTWYQGNFTGVLNNPASNETMLGKKRGE